MKAERPILAQKNIKRDFSIWQLLGLERTLLSELPHTPNFVSQAENVSCLGSGPESGPDLGPDLGLGSGLGPVLVPGPVILGPYVWSRS